MGYWPYWRSVQPKAWCQQFNTGYMNDKLCFFRLWSNIGLCRRPGYHWDWRNASSWSLERGICGTRSWPSVPSSCWALTEGELKWYRHHTAHARLCWRRLKSPCMMMFVWINSPTLRSSCLGLLDLALLQSRGELSLHDLPGRAEGNQGRLLKFSHHEIMTIHGTTERQRCMSFMSASGFPFLAEIWKSIRTSLVRSCKPEFRKIEETFTQQGYVSHEGSIHRILLTLLRRLKRTLFNRQIRGHRRLTGVIAKQVQLADLLNEIIHYFRQAWDGMYFT